MPQIDNLISKLVEKKVERALLINDEPLKLFIAGQETQGQSPMSSTVIEAMLREIMPANLQPQLGQSGSFQFPFQSFHGIYNIAVERNDGKLQVSVTPFLPFTSMPSHPQSVQSPNLISNQPPQAATRNAPPVLPASVPQKTMHNNGIIAGAIGLVVLIVMGFGIRSATMKPKQETITANTTEVTDRGSAVNSQYLQEISGLSQVGIKIKSFPSDQVGEDYLIASGDTVAFNSAVQGLEKRIRDDPALGGSETAGQKAELLNNLKGEITKNAPFQRALAINKKTGELACQMFGIHGKKALTFSGVQNVVMSYKGTEGLIELHRAKEDKITSVAKAMLMNGPLTARN